MVFTMKSPAITIHANDFRWTYGAKCCATTTSAARTLPRRATTTTTWRRYSAIDSWGPSNRSTKEIARGTGRLKENGFLGGFRLIFWWETLMEGDGRACKSDFGAPSRWRRSSTIWWRASTCTKRCAASSSTSATTRTSSRRTPTAGRARTPNSTNSSNRSPPPHPFIP